MSIKYPLADDRGSLVWARDLAAVGERPTTLRCVGCEEKVVLRSGARNQPHFAHDAGSDCTVNETALHKATIWVLSEGLADAARKSEQFAFPVACSFCEAMRLGDLARDPGCTADVNLQLSNGIRPDILIRGADGEPKFVIEVIVTHAPEENALEEYRAHDLPVIAVYPSWETLESMRTGLEGLAQRGGSADTGCVELLSRCRFPRHINSEEGELQVCARCAAPARLVTVEVAEGLCGLRSCSRHVRVLDINTRLGDHRVLIAAGAEELKGTDQIARELNVRLEDRFSKRANAKYCMNVCECGAHTGDNYAYGNFGKDEFLPSTRDPVKRYVICAGGHWQHLSTHKWSEGVSLVRSSSKVGLIGAASGIFGTSADEDPNFQFTWIDKSDISKMVRKIVWGGS